MRISTLPSSSAQRVEHPPRRNRGATFMQTLSKVAKIALFSFALFYTPSCHAQGALGRTTSVESFQQCPVFRNPFQREPTEMNPLRGATGIITEQDAAELVSERLLEGMLAERPEAQTLELLELAPSEANDRIDSRPKLLNEITYHLFSIQPWQLNIALRDLRDKTAIIVEETFSLLQKAKSWVVRPEVPPLPSPFEIARKMEEINRNHADRVAGTPGSQPTGDREEIEVGLRERMAADKRYILGRQAAIPGWLGMQQEERAAAEKAVELRGYVPEEHLQGPRTIWLYRYLFLKDMMDAIPEHLEMTPAEESDVIQSVRAEPDFSSPFAMLGDLVTTSADMATRTTESSSRPYKPTVIFSSFPLETPLPAAEEPKESKSVGEKISDEASSIPLCFSGVKPSPLGLSWAALKCGLKFAAKYGWQSLPEELKGQIGERVEAHKKEFIKIFHSMTPEGRRKIKETEMRIKAHANSLSQKIWVYRKVGPLGQSISSETHATGEAVQGLFDSVGGHQASDSLTGPGSEGSKYGGVFIFNPVTGAWD